MFKVVKINCPITGKIRWTLEGLRFDKYTPIFKTKAAAEKYIEKLFSLA